MYILRAHLAKILTNFDIRLLSRAAPNIPKTAHNETIIPKPSITKAAVSKSNFSNI